jgi:hypothetical protein
MTTRLFQKVCDRRIQTRRAAGRRVGQIHACRAAGRSGGRAAQADLYFLSRCRYVDLEIWHGPSDLVNKKEDKRGVCLFCALSNVLGAGAGRCFAKLSVKLKGPSL